MLPVTCDAPVKGTPTEVCTCCHILPLVLLFPFGAVVPVVATQISPEFKRTNNTSELACRSIMFAAEKGSPVIGAKVAPLTKSPSTTSPTPPQAYRLVVVAKNP